MKTSKTIISLICFLVISILAFGQSNAEKQLQQLKKLYDQNLITKTEYDNKRQTILNDLIGGGVDDEITYCHFITAADEEIDFSDTEDDVNLVKVGQIIKKILDASGNVAIFDLRANRTIPNATAVILKKKRYIQYNPRFVANASPDINDWTIYGVFAHEIGHHINFHLSGRDNRLTEELEADDFCGFILNKMGANLSQAQQSIRKLDQDDTDSATHPARSKRLKAIERGWKKAEAQKTNTGMDDATKKFHEVVDEADKFYTDGYYDEALMKYERAKSMKGSDTYVLAQIKKIKEKKSKPEPIDDYKKKDPNYDEVSELLKKLEYDPPKENEYRPPAKTRGQVTVFYRGDNLGCSLNVKIRIGDREFFPSGNSFTVSDIPLGHSTYEVTGTISCALSGVCTIYAQTANIEVLDNALLYLYWNNTAYATCSSWLSYQ